MDLEHLLQDHALIALISAVSILAAGVLILVSLYGAIFGRQLNRDRWKWPTILSDAGTGVTIMAMNMWIMLG